jgi:predicted ATPase
MRIKSVKLTRFKRFADLTLQGIPQSAKLVVLAGPNGSGKTSLFEALNSWHRLIWRGVGGWESSYHVKQEEGQPSDLSWNQTVNLEFYDPQPATPEERFKAIYVRTAHRNEPGFELQRLERSQPASLENRFNKMTDNDAAVSLNYARLAANGLEDAFEKEDPRTTIGEFRDKAIGGIRDSIQRLFPDLVLNSLGNPLTNGTFKFDKGTSKGFQYKNLSGGEKAAFDILLDFVVKIREFDNTVFCIDEPEAHMNPRLQGVLLEELFTLLPAASQLWLATHSIGMMRRARDLAALHPGEVIFLDFEGHDFDKAQTLQPVLPTRVFWERTLRVALDDLAELVAPKQVVVCEGKPLGAGSGRVAVDANCYNLIFGSEFPDARFLSAGNAADVAADRLAFTEAIKALAGGISVTRLIDRDDRSPQEIAQLQAQGVRVLSRRHLESYLYDDEILAALCVQRCNATGAPGLIADKQAAIASSVARHNAPDDVKSASGEIYNAAKRRLGLVGVGNDSSAFMQSTLAPLVTGSTVVYAQLRREIFGV